MPKRILQGIVVSDKAAQTVTVRVERKVMHPVYKKFIRRSKRYAAHDESNNCKVGDTVMIRECRPLSKTKRWRVVNIVERALGLMEQPSIKPLIDIPHMAKLVETMVRKSLDAFVRKDAELARTVLASDDAVDDLRDTIYQELIRTMQDDPADTPQCVNLMFVARNLERIADHATNIAEDVLFLVQGIDVRHHSEKPPSPVPEGEPQ